MDKNKIRVINISSSFRLQSKAIYVLIFMCRFDDEKESLSSNSPLIKSESKSRHNLKGT